MANAGSVSINEILLAFSKCDPFPQPVFIGRVKERILAERFGSFAPYASEYSLTNTVQRMVETRCAKRSGSKPPYSFEATSYGMYRLTEAGQARLKDFTERDERQRAEEQKKKQEAEQRSFLMSRTEPTNRPELVEFNGRRFVRDYPAAIKLKQIYGYSCQVCGCTVATFEGVHYDNQGYAEVHHIRPLGSGHDGPDYPANLLVLCPNHHAAFDLSTMALNPDSLKVYYLEPDGGVYKQGPLFWHESNHEFDRECLMYAWGLWLNKLGENRVDISQAELDWS